MTATSADSAHAPGAIPTAATLGALGVVYGDIGTSPLYALKEAAKAATGHGGTLTPEAVLGVVSLIFWALILIISIKYACLIMRADNRGEGGIVALLALLHARHAQAGTWRAWSSASSATMPPSPRLSARRINSAYLIEMMRISAHRISDTTPRTASLVSGPPLVAALAASFRA